MIEIRLPKLGEGIDAGRVVTRLVKPGDAVRAGQGLIEVESGKATVEVPAEAAGRIETLAVEEGDTIRPGDLIATLDPAVGGAAPRPATNETAPRPVAPAPKAAPPTSEDAVAQAPDAAADVPEAPAAPPPARPPAAEEPFAAPNLARQGVVMATPLVRRLARELGLEIRTLTGTGSGGRLTEADVKQAARILVERIGPAPRGRTSAQRGEGEPYDEFGAIRHEPLNAVRLETARRLAASWPAVPQVTHFAKADTTQLDDARARYERGSGRKLGPTALLVKLLGRALTAHPKLHAQLDLDRREVVYRQYVNIGVAVDTPRGLLVPVIRNVERKTAPAIQAELTGLAEQARAGKLPLEAMRGGSFTISNLGGLGGEWFTPLVNPGEAAILGVGRARREPVFVGETLQARPLLPLSLSYDHRLIDGADAARFLRALIDLLENPLLALLEEAD